MKLLITIASIFIINYPLSVLCQNEDDNMRYLEDIIEDITATSDKEPDLTSLSEDLLYLSKNPLNINSSNAESLRKLQFINEEQINNLLAYITSNGCLLSIYELRYIDGFNNGVIEKILPFVRIDHTEENHSIVLKNIPKQGHSQLFLKSMRILEHQKGFSPVADSVLNKSPNSHYLGDPYRIYFRYTFHYQSRIFAGITAEKDAGEEFFRGTQKKGFDYYSAHLVLNNISMLKILAFGDYEVQFGQGITIATGSQIGSTSGDALNILKRSYGIKKYSSADENRFMRGIAATARTKDFEISAFYSKKKIDANVTTVDSLTNEVLAVSSLQNTGYHTTPVEMENKDAVKETITGGNISLKKERLKLGVTYIYYSYGSKLLKNSRPYNQFEFSGDSNFIFGFDYLYKTGDMVFFGEESVDKSLAFAILNGAVFAVIPQVSFCFLHRSYDRKFSGTYSSAFGQNSRPANESGIYLGMEMFISQAWKISACYDYYDFPWLKYFTSAPSSGSSYSVQVNYQTLQKLSIYLRIKCVTGKKNNSGLSANINKPVKEEKMNWRINFNCKIAENLRVSNRIEISRYDLSGCFSCGYMAYQDIRCNFTKLPLVFSFRYTIFDTESYESRIYTFEDDLLYEYSSPSFYSKGSRAYIIIRYYLNDNASFWFRAGQTWYPNMQRIGSGPGEINGQTKTDIKAMVKISF